jgi:hypothetical protein
MTVASKHAAASAANEAGCLKMRQEHFDDICMVRDRMTRGNCAVISLFEPGSGACRLRSRGVSRTISAHGSDKEIGIASLCFLRRSKEAQGVESRCPKSVQYLGRNVAQAGQFVRRTALLPGVSQRYEAFARCQKVAHDFGRVSWHEARAGPMMSSVGSA